MERLTERNESGQAYYKKCFEEPCNGMGERDCDTCEHSYAVCERLAEYEDLEITAEQVKDIDKAYTDLCAEFGEYKKLEEKGLLLKLPCKVGDIIWDNDFGEPWAYEVTGYSYGDLGGFDECTELTTDEIVIYYKCQRRNGIIGQSPVSEIGKSVFLSQEAAEQALKRLESE